MENEALSILSVNLFEVEIREDWSFPYSFNEQKYPTILHFACKNYCNLKATSFTTFESPPINNLKSPGSATNFKAAL